MQAPLYRFHLWFNSIYKATRTITFPSNYYNYCPIKQLHKLRRNRVNLFTLFNEYFVKRGQKQKRNHKNRCKRQTSKIIFIKSKHKQFITSLQFFVTFATILCKKQILQQKLMGRSMRLKYMAKNTNIVLIAT